MRSIAEDEFRSRLLEMTCSSDDIRSVRIGLLTSSYPQNADDYSGVFVKKLEEALYDIGVRIRLVAPTRFKALTRAPGLIANLRTSTLARLLFPFYCMSLQLSIVRIARQCNVLHANWTHTGLFAVLANMFFRRKLVLTIRSSMLVQTKSRWLSGVVGWVARRCDAVVTISEQANKELSAKYPDLNILTIPNGVDDVRFSPTDRKRRRKELGVSDECLNVLAVGRLVDSKDFQTFIRSISECVHQAYPIRVYLAGDGPLKGTLETLARHEGVCERISFLGRLAPEDVARWMSAADVFVQCSTAETGGNVILEALSSGLAVASTPVGWAADFIDDGVNGFIFPTGDATALGAILESLATDRAMLAEIQQNARQTVIAKGLTWADCASRYLDVYKQVLDCDASPSEPCCTLECGKPAKP